MIKLYTDEDLWNAMQQRKRILNIFYAVLAFYLLLLTATTVWYVMLPYNDPMGKWVLFIASVYSTLFIVFAFPYMGICFKRINAYYKMLQSVSTGLKEFVCAPFAGIEDWETHDGVDVNVASFTFPSVKRDEIMIRHIFIDGEKDFPPFEEGQKVKMVLHGNLLVEYEIVEEI